MSHFTVTVKVSAERIARHELAARTTAASAVLDGESPILPSRHHIIKAALAEMLEPYNENGGAETFVDEEDAERKRWETESTRRVRTPEGALLLPWDNRFRVPGTFGFGGGSHAIPDDCTEIEVPFRETYATFEDFCADWLEQERDEKTGRIGHWANKDAKWDWWTIGGRWTGFYPLKPGRVAALGEPGAFDNKAEDGRGDIVRVSDLDLDKIATETRERAEKFFRAWTEWCAAPDNRFDSPRSRALTIGMCRVVEGPAETGPGEIAIPWALHIPPTDPRAGWTDVCRVLGADAFLAEHIDHFNPIVTYAALDDSGWHAPGKMGWFGCSSDTPDVKGDFVKAFVRRFVKTASADDLLVVVDCHI